MQVLIDPADVRRRPSDPATGPIPALLALLADAQRAGIRLCSWKSNDHLAAAMAGRTDVDLLVHREDAARFREVMARHGCRSLVPSPGGAHPGIEHHLGMDPDSGRLFHLHVHHQLVLGEHHVKNHRLPMEAALLVGSESLDGVPVPRPEAELAVLTVRALLKYRARDVVKDVLRIRSVGVPASTRAEIRWLADRTTPARVAQVLEASSAPVPADLVVRFLRQVEADPRGGWVLLGLRSRLRRSLRTCQRRSRAGAMVESLHVSWQRRTRLRTGVAPTRMTPTTGGLTIALVGADGAGKSTVAGELATWLGWKLDTRLLYLGSTQPSAPTRWLYVAFRVTRRSHRAATARVPGLAAPAASLRDTVHALHCLAVARDRLAVLRSGHRAARSGRVVVFDRFPLFPLTGVATHRLLDGPRIPDEVATAGAVRGLLARVERRCYRRFRAPDLVVALQVPPNVALARKPDHDAGVVTRKSRAVADLAATAPPHLPVVHVRADRPLTEVLLDVRRRVWDVL